MVILIDGVEIADKIKGELKNNVAKCKRPPCLVVIIVGEDPASQVYVRNKEKACKKCGIKSVKYELLATTSEDELLSLIEKLNNDNEVDGLLVQLPVPKHIDEKKIIKTISPDKDVDCFHSVNVGKMFIGDIREKSMLPCTAKGCVKLIKSVAGNVLDGKKVCVVGRSNIVGKPVAQLLLRENCTVKIVHSKTTDLADETKWADILVVAIGRANFIKADMVKQGAVVIDVGMNRLEDGKFVGDVDFDDVKDKISYITPVPGGVGPMTITCLLENVYNAYLENN